MNPVSTSPNDMKALAPTGGIDLSAAITAAASLGKEGVEVLERLHAIAKEERAMAARAAFFKAMAAFQREMPHVLKTVEGAQKATRKGTRTVGLYAPLDSITAALNPVASRNGLSYRFDRETKDGRDYILCIVHHEAGHAESSRFPVKDDSTTGRNAIQAVASGESYAKRYALIAAFGITTADPDDDGEASVRNGETITEEQAANLGAMLDEAPDPKAERAGLLKWQGVASLSEILSERFADVVRAVDTKRKKGWTK